MVPAWILPACLCRPCLSGPCLFGLCLCAKNTAKHEDIATVVPAYLHEPACVDDMGAAGKPLNTLTVIGEASCVGEFLFFLGSD